MSRSIWSGLDIKAPKELPIGVFDSGVGGLTIVKEMLNILPKESIIYLGDTARVPYGGKSCETVLRFTKEAVDFFITKGVKLLLIACNTSSSLALPYLGEDYDLAMLGVVDAGAEEAVKVSRVKRIGVIGTKATIASGIYERKIKELDSKIEVFSSSCPLFVPLVEEGWAEDAICYRIAERYLKELKNKKIDTLILGCTHYPLMKKIIQYGIGESVALIDSAKLFVKQVRRLLSNCDKLSAGVNPSYEFYVTDEANQFSQMSRLFLGSNLAQAQRVELKEHKNVSNFNKV
ncbi:MAG: glutamate racemase [Candidatus Omnitrophica bacterium]|nr:glutamate racemase [Candidatus Omnitrophota bacterium]